MTAVCGAPRCEDGRVGLNHATMIRSRTYIAP